MVPVFQGRADVGHPGDTCDWREHNPGSLGEAEDRVCCCWPVRLNLARVDEAARIRTHGIAKALECRLDVFVDALLEGGSVS